MILLPFEKRLKALSLQTDASYRFERGVDSDGQLWAATRAATLIAELGGGTLIDGANDAHPRPITPPTIEVRHSRIGKIIGHEIDNSEVVRLLTRIGFDVTTNAAGDMYTCKTPAFRPDIEREIDVIEEVARLSGYHNIPEPAQITVPGKTPVVLPGVVLRRKVKSLLLGQGFRETCTNSMLRKEVAESFNIPVLTQADGSVVETLKPISQEMAALRPSLLPGLLTVIGYNQNRGQRALRFMEFGRVFQERDVKHVPVPGYAEHTSLLLCICGPREETHWSSGESNVQFHDLKGIVEVLLESLHAPPVEMRAVYEPTSVTAYHLELYAGKKHLGVIAALAEEQREIYNVRDQVFFAELNWDVLLPLIEPGMRAQYQKF